MKILIVSEVFWPEDFMINDLAREWVKMGHTVEVLTQYPSYPQSYVFDGYVNKGHTDEEWDGIRIHRFPFIEGYRDSKLRKFENYLYFIREGKKLGRKLETKYDCVFVSQTGPLTVAYPALAVGRQQGIPVYIWTFDLWPDVVYSYGVPRNKVTDWILTKVISKIYNGCSKIFVSSKRFEETISQYTDTEIIYAPNWLRPSEEVRSELRLPADKINFTFTGNISRYQNLENTVRGFAKAALPNAQLNIVGDGSYAEAVRRVTAETGATNVVMHGRRPYAEMADVLAQSDVLVMPLMPHEGIEKTEPLKLQSYLAAGKPVLGILRGSGRDIIEEGEIGLCAEPDDVDDIACAFREVITYARDHAETVRNNAKSFMEERFNKDRIVKAITESISR